MKTLVACLQKRELGSWYSGNENISLYTLLWLLNYKNVFSQSFLSHVWLFAAPWTIACQAPLSMEISVKNTCTSQIALVVKNPPANAGDSRDLSSIPGSGRCPRERNGNAPVFFPRESHGLRSLVGYSP